MRNLIRALIAALSLATLPVVSDAGVFVGVSVNIAPPELPVYVQPPPPAAGYIWIPGYWAWADEDYYWVPGTWALAPSVGLLWTPGYWGWESGVYMWRGGRQRPGSGDPVVALVSPRPVSGDPDVAGRRARRLDIDREFRRRDVDRQADKHSCIRHHRKRRERQGRNETADQVAHAMDSLPGNLEPRLLNRG